MDLTELKQAVERLQRCGGEKGRLEGWRSLEELADTTEFRELLEREFAVPPDEADNRAGLKRREFLQILGGTLGLAGLAGLAGCTVRPRGEIVPYVEQPESLVPGKPLFYATALEFGGYGRGVLVETHEGRPTKVEGNRLHPASLGATSLFEQATILDLYNPARSAAVLHRNGPGDWPAYLQALQTALLKLPPGGEGLHLLTGTITSPAFGEQWNMIVQRYPAARWHRYEPIHDDAFLEAERGAGWEPSEHRYHFDRARVVVSFGCDFLFALPGSVRYARELMAGRSGERAEMNRIYVLESVPTLTGAYADEREAVRTAGPDGIAAHAAALAAELGVEVRFSGTWPGGGAAAWARRVAADLLAERNRNGALLLAGGDQPPVVHSLVRAMNARLGSYGDGKGTISLLPPLVQNRVHQGESLAELAAAMKAGKARVVMMLGGDWVQTAPADLDFAEALEQVPLSIHCGLYLDKTARRATWHLPQAHPLEAWGDTRSFDGTASLCQPMIEPLYGGHSLHEVLDGLARFPGRSGYEIIRSHWVAPGRLDEAAWRRALHDGVVEGSAPVAAAANPGGGGQVEVALGEPEAGLELVLGPDPSLWDGRYAQNAWLQELPRPIHHLSWGNAFLIGPATGERLGLESGEWVRVRGGEEEVAIEGPVVIQPGVADGAVGLTLGCGLWAGSDESPFRVRQPTVLLNRTEAAHERGESGVDAYPIRTRAHPWRRAVVLERTGRNDRAVTTQHHHLMEGRDLLRMGTRAELLERYPASGNEPLPTFYNLTEEMNDAYAWAMVIDLTRCIGCNACVVACQAENNIPPVGRDQVERGREMHWIRVDTYHFGDPDQPEFGFQPLACVHCETAPCEPVCPVEATVHDREGLNLQVYNRCIGTRYCSNNCPYKVRRFNFFRYAEGSAREPLQLMANPNVTVRARGVMEKCTYCVQRINAARISARKENRLIRDGEVIPACAQACPTETIVFGNRNDRGSRVAKRKESPFHYALLGDRNTRPRTTYLARLRNPDRPPSAT
ncbi:MAG TPA: TAT-variant-translocated molybdopterin oxidoreductase [Chthoniobacteraceae bacterium]|nr:TAT-variant-translocated molybdopterin oxidoreductase [Chthoniobacteraceae bacterium]